MRKILTDFKQGNIVQIEDVNCGNDFKRRLGELGLFVGSKIKIIKNDNFGPLIIKVFDSKIAMDRVEAKKVYAQKIN